MNKRPKPLYRKVNTKTRGVRHRSGSDFKYSRNTKRDSRERVKGSMTKNDRRGLDYTPLFRFLLSKVGCNWDEVYSEAKSRLERSEPIFWVVAKNNLERKDYVRIGDSSYFSGLYVDEYGDLQLTNPQLSVDDLATSCDCCTHTFNGEIIESSEDK